jgi:hypothetical protein
VPLLAFELFFISRTVCMVNGEDLNLKLELRSDREVSLFATIEVLQQGQFLMDLLICLGSMFLKNCGEISLD